MLNRSTRPNIGITMGDPAGIGAEIIAKSLMQKQIQRLADFTVIGDSFVFKKLGLYQNIISHSTLIDLTNVQKKGFSFGKINALGAKASVEYIDRAIKLIKDSQINCLVTAPVNKESINRAGIKFSGHTEYIAQKTETKGFAMMFVSPALKVILVTRHIPLSQVSKDLSKDKIYKTIKLTIKCLKDNFKITKPRIAVCGLNPHAGEAGYLGREEKNKIIPAIGRIKKEFSCDIQGPIASDTLFYFSKKGVYDAVIAMYHDQGLIPLKLLAFESAVNFTVGLPFIRTSPSHGTAYNIAGQNKADPGSMIEAIKLAAQLCRK